MSEPMVQHSLVILKPDALARRLVGRILSRLEDKEIDIVAMKMLHLDKETAERLYAPHRGKYFYPRLICFTTCAPVIVLVCRGRMVIERIRQLMGEADPASARPGTIRGDFSCHQTYNLIHASDTPASAEREISIFFTAEEMVKTLAAQFPWHAFPELSENQS